MKKLTIIAVLALAAVAAWNEHGVQRFNVASSTASDSDQVFANAFATQRSGFQAEGEGTVTRILADDREGGQHQRFIIRLGAGQTLLIAHNIDIASRVADLREGDRVAFNGEYEWNSQGGLIHWTHRDPNGSHVTGWIKHGGHTYQ